MLDEWRLTYNHRRPHSGIGWQIPAAYAARLMGTNQEVDGVVSSASLADPPVGATPLSPAQPAHHTPAIL